VAPLYTLGGAGAGPLRQEGPHPMMPRMVMGRLGVGALLAVWALSSASGCADPKRKMEEAQRRRDAEKKAFEEAREARARAAAPKVERARLALPWASPEFLTVAPGTPCPEGTWALFPGTPGEGAAVAANEARRPELATRLKEATFVAVLPLGGAVSFGKYDPRKKALPVELDGVLECFDGLGLLSFSLDQPARPFRPPTEDPAVSPQAVWRAPPLVVQVPFATAEEARAFTQGPGSGLEARVVFRTGPVATDTRVAKPPPAAAGEPPAAGSIDWGAGRLVRARLVGVRLAVDHEKVEVATRLKP